MSSLCRGLATDLAQHGVGGGGGSGKRTSAESTMVLSESPSAACRQALQRAWHVRSPPRDEDDAPYGMRLEEDVDDRGLDLRLTTFNLLAPCYKRMHPEALPSGVVGNGLLAGQAKASTRTSRESEFADLWRQRAVETVNFIKREMSSSDVICLQEFWFDPGYEAIFRSALGADYNFHTLQRTGSKADGVAVLLRRGKFEVRSSHGLSLSSVGDRVALVMHLRIVRPEGDPTVIGGVEGTAAVGEGVTVEGEDLLLVNTHLAFPHHMLDRANQMSQILAVTNAVEGLVRDAGLPPMTPRVVVGDLNVEESDAVCRHLSENGFRSAFASLHREQRVVTHRNHRGEEVMVDHVFVKAPGFADRRRGSTKSRSVEVPGLVPHMHEDVVVEEAKLLPDDIDGEAWCPRFSLSDHRPLTVRLQFPMY